MFARIAITINLNKLIIFNMSIIKFKMIQDGPGSGDEHEEIM